MNINEFDTFAFGGNMYAKTHGRNDKRFIISVNFPERLFGILDEKPEGDFDAWDIDWIRCESVNEIYLGDDVNPIFESESVNA